jgi:Lipocalin-like domain
VKNKILKMASLTLIVVALFVTSCSKDSQVEHNLENVKTWQIDQIFYQKAQAGTSGVKAKVSTEYNCGVLIFDKDGTGSYDYMLDGQHRVGSYKWTITAGNLTFNYAAASSTGAQAATYNIIHQTKTSVVLQGSEALVDVTGTFALDATFSLRK